MEKDSKIFFSEIQPLFDLRKIRRIFKKIYALQDLFQGTCMAGSHPGHKEGELVIKFKSLAL
jgi:hypothetical protein